MKLVFQKRTTDSILNVSSFEFTNILKIQTLINPAKLPSGQITSIHEHKEQHCSSRNIQGSNYLVALETIISLIRGKPRVLSMDTCLGESLWYHPGVWPAHGLYSECIHFRAWLHLCHRRKGTEGDLMHQRKGQQRCWGTETGYCL